MRPPAPDPLRAQKSLEAERRVALLRLLVVGQGSVTVLVLMDPAATVAWLADALMAISWGYSLWMVIARPHIAAGRGLYVERTATVAVDTFFIALWVYATGGPHSPFILLAYLSVFAVAFRHSAREAVIAAVLYDLAYVALLASRHELTLDLANTFTRMAYVFFAATIGAFLVGQVSGARDRDHEPARSARSRVAPMRVAWKRGRASSRRRRAKRSRRRSTTSRR